MRRHRWVLCGAGAVLLAACADGPGPVVSVTPEIRRAVAPDGHEVPSYSSASSVPPEYAWAEVRSHRERVTWDGNSATGYGSMEYFGNRGRIVLQLQVLNGYSTVGTTRTEREQADFLPAVRMMGIPLPYAVPETCGQTANLMATFSARTILFIETKITEVGPHTVGGHADAAQPACPEPDPEPCGDGPGEYMSSVSPAPAPGANASPDGYFYDPYDPGYDTGTCSGCDGGGAGGGDEGGNIPEESFPQMCDAWGGKLYYDYGCIEKYNWDTGNWDQIWCGTYAVCET